MVLFGIWGVITVMSEDVPLFGQGSCWATGSLVGTTGASAGTSEVSLVGWGACQGATEIVVVAVGATFAPSSVGDGC